MTLADVIRDYQGGLLTAKGFLFYAVSCQRRQGEAIEVNPDRLCGLVGLSKTSFYRAIAALKLQHRMDFEISGRMTLKIPIHPPSGEPEYIFLGELSQKGDNFSQKGDNFSQKGDNFSQKGDNFSQKGDNFSQKGDNFSQKGDSKPLELSQDRGSRTPQSIQSIQSLSLTESERETAIDSGFRKWLTEKAASLPTPPALLERWLETQAKKPSNQKGYQQYLDTLQQRAIPENLPVEEIIDPTSADYWQRVHQRGGSHG
jgi:hypothetical protein